jgi:serine/threonine protein kinase
MLNVLAFLHENGIWHRDIKAENILVLDPKNIGDSVVLSDFGLCKIYPNGSYSTDFCGSPFSFAPELVLRVPYTEKADIWALGITLVACFTATLPMNTGSREVAEADILDGLPELDLLLIDFDVPNEPADLIRNMLARSPEDRLSAREALQSPWFDDLRPLNAA